MSTDNPESDGTDLAHPAWWRGEKTGVEGMCRIVNDWLDGKPSLDSGTYGAQCINELRIRIKSLLKVHNVD